MFLTVQDMDEDMIQGFEAEADDYITKPFNIKILKQRIEAILRRCEPKDTKSAPLQVFGELTVDFEAMVVKKKGEKGKALALPSGLNNVIRW